MKIRSQFIPFLALLFLISACAKDNFTEPKSTLSGRIVYNGEPIAVEYNQVRLQLWQPGFGKLAAIDTQVDQNGSFSALLFNGKYKLVVPKGRGPFKTLEKDAAAKDTLFVTLEGNQQLDLEVMPYYMIRTPQFAGAENKVTATLKLEKIINGADAKAIEQVSLFINKTEFVSRSTNVGVTDIAGADVKNLNAITIATEIPALVPTQKYVFARVGVKIKDVEDMIFSPVQKVEFK
ncbi:MULTISPECIES: DUF3823 domain-containing protein [unclassified Dyadobacter]|jgi:hypothetical protein|nr:MULTISPECIES: DUF3823 domain-containing protein [unclassified Dyadobacter]MCE7069578.1 DUF3823 domain-containing protein [Dyadobacter sp. CY327]MCF2516542.1 DUF3823 domain-containing protein [Dyadobacter sp. CY351]